MQNKTSVLSFFWFNIILFFYVPLPAVKNRFIIDICSYNNRMWFRRNLDSIFGANGQKYQNIHVFYTDDCSSDGTADLVEKYIKDNGVEDKVTLIRNSQRRKQLANHYRVAQMCNDDDIIVVLDGDDNFAHPWVLRKLSRIYKDPNIWMTYGQFKNWPTNVRGYCKKTPESVIEKNSYREYNWYWGHMRTYRAWLAKQVKLEDLIVSDIKDLDILLQPNPSSKKDTISAMKGYQGHFFPASADLALGYPMLEMARSRVKYLSGINYIRNVANPINTFKTQLDVQRYSAKCIRSKNRYNQIFNPVKSDYRNNKADVFIYFNNNIIKLEKCIQSINRYLKGINDVYLVYEKSKLLDFDKVAFKNQNSKIKFVEIGKSSAKEVLLRSLRLSNAQYVICAQETDTVTGEIDASKCIEILEKTFAYGFYFHPGKDNFTSLYEWTGLNNFYFWQFKLAQGLYHPYDVHLGLYRKKDFIDVLGKCSINALETLESELSRLPFDGNKIGLFLSKSRGAIQD